MTDKISPSDAKAHWASTRRLMWVTLTIWAIFSFFIHFFVSSLNEIIIMGFPLGFYMASQGSLVIFVVLIFWFSWSQNRIDEKFGVAED